MELHPPSPATVADVRAILLPKARLPLARAMLAELVEAPLLPAVEQCWDKNVLTLESHANWRESASTAFLRFDHDSLSEENLRHLEEQGWVVEALDTREFTGKVVTVSFQMSRNTPVEEIRNWALTIVDGLQKQSALWIPSLDQAEMEREVSVLSNLDLTASGEIPPEQAVKLHKTFRYFDPARGRYFLSPEHAEKWQPTEVTGQSSR